MLLSITNVLHHSTPCSSLPLNYHMPWLNFQLRHLLAQKARADGTAGISKAWAFRLQRYSDVGNSQPIKSQKWASPFKQPTNTSALGTVLLFSSLRFQWWLWLTSSEQNLLCHLPWAELQHRFTHSPFLLPGDSHTFFHQAANADYISTLSKWNKLTSIWWSFRVGTQALTQNNSKAVNHTHFSLLQCCAPTNVFYCNQSDLSRGPNSCLFQTQNKTLLLRAIIPKTRGFLSM